MKFITIYFCKKRKKELSSLNKEKKELITFYANERKNQTKNTKIIINKEKEKDMKDLNEKIEKIRAMNLIEYLKYSNNKENNENGEEKEEGKKNS